VTTKRRKRSKVIFKGSGFGWFPIPRFFLGDEINRGKLFGMAPSPELRLYLVLLSETGKEEKPVLSLENALLMKLAKLDRTYLPRARKALVKAGLIKAKRVGMKVYRYEILGEEGRSLTGKTPDDWGSSSDFDLALQT